MQKILFLEFAELRQGDGRGPKYLAGKAYWLTPDQAVRWKSEGIAEDAPEDMAAENEYHRGPIPLRPENVRIIKRKNKYHVTGPEGYHPFHDEPLNAHEAEKLRQSILTGEHKAVVIEPEPAPEPEIRAAIEPEPEFVDPYDPAADPVQEVASGENPT